MNPETKKLLIIGGSGLAVTLAYLYLKNRAAGAADQVVAESGDAAPAMPTFDMSAMPSITAPALSSLDDLIAALSGGESAGSGGSGSTTTTQTQVDGTGTTTTGTVPTVDHNVPTNTGEGVAMGDAGVTAPIRTGTAKVVNRAMMIQ